jgi:hypothetical protein
MKRIFWRTPPEKEIGRRRFNNAMFTATNTTPSYTPTGNDMVYP